MEFSLSRILDHKPGLRKILATTAVIIAYSLLNYFMRIHLPGVSNIDLRPQIVLLVLIGYLYGPIYGFIAGFVGNFFSDILLSNGLRYLPSWTIGNGLIGALIGFYPYRKRIRLDQIGQLAWLLLFLILVNVVALSYAAGMENFLDRSLTSAVNFRYFYLPATLSNVLGTLLLLPVILLTLGRLKKNYPLKLALANYYLIGLLLIIVWMALVPTDQVYQTLFASAGLEVAKGNALVDAFNQWALMLVTMLILSFFISSWMAKAIINPLKQLESAVFSTLRGDPAAVDHLAGLVKREDEVGILSYTVRLLSEKLWETQKLSQDELEKSMKFLDARDSGTSIFIITLIALFGRDALGEQKDEVILEMDRDLSNLAAVSLIITACGLKELAATYSDAKIGKSLAGMDSINSDASLSQEQRQILALAIDVNLLFKGRLKVMDVHATLSRELAFHLLERAQSFRKSSKNYVGYVTEPDIVSKMLDKWESSVKVRSEKLESVMRKATSRQVIIGYQIKNLSDLARFDTDLSIAYSHSNFKHIKQLIGLLASENLQAKLQLEPKRSCFYYRDEWERTANLQLERFGDGVWINHTDEFDMVMEFTDREHRDRFKEVIEAYAKREFKTEKKVLFGAWYEPLYRLDVPVEGYIRISDISIRDETHIVHSYVKEEEAPEKVEWFKKELPDSMISITAVWVNEAFFRYLNAASD